jgi:GntR family transcriptional regulator/MocR family aminotransferase
VPGAQSTADYASLPPQRPALAFGYGVIDVEAIRPALAALRRALER